MKKEQLPFHGTSQWFHGQNDQLAFSAFLVSYILLTCFPLCA